MYMTGNVHLVTGAAGLVGANLVRALLAQGVAVRAMIHSDQRTLAGLDVELVQGDVRDPASLERACQGAEVVYHLAGLISIEMGGRDRLEQINVIGVRNVVNACLHSRVRRLVHFSSIHAFLQEPLDQPLDESRPLVNMVSAEVSQQFAPYDLTKAMGEDEVRAGVARGLDAVILNPTGILGPQDIYPSFFGRALLMMARGRLPVLVQGGFDWVDARDVALGAIQAAQLAPAGAQYLLGGHWRSVKELAALVGELRGRPAARLAVPLGLAKLGVPLFRLWGQLTHSQPLYTDVSLQALRGNHHISHARATRELGYSPRPLEETLADTLDWFNQHGMLPPLMSKPPASEGIP